MPSSTSIGWFLDDWIGISSKAFVNRILFANQASICEGKKEKKEKESRTSTNEGVEEKNLKEITI